MVLINGDLNLLLVSVSRERSMQINNEELIKDILHMHVALLISMNAVKL